jgi:hypothetical protein
MEEGPREGRELLDPLRRRLDDRLRPSEADIAK